MIKLKYIVFITAIVCFASFSWALQCFFTKPTKKNIGLGLIYIFGTLFIFVHLFSIIFLYPSNTTIANIGLAFYLSSLCLFWWSVYTNYSKPLSAAFSSDQPLHLINTGPYRIIRHPFYVSYTLSWLAGAIIVDKFWLYLTVIMMFILYWCAAVNEERKFEKSSLATSYKRYQEKVGMFLPKIFSFIFSTTFIFG